MDNAVYQLTFLVTFAAISLTAVKRRATSAEDFAVANRSLSARGVSWVIIGTLVGGVSTIGTVQTAYTHGISAGIFAFGSGLSCLLLGCFFARALREEGAVTISEYLGRFFGQRFRYYCSFINSLGMFIHVVGQFLAAIAILQAVFHFGDSASVFITLAVLLLASVLVFTGLDSTILRWSYLSMGLRGSAVFAGLVVLVFFSKIATSSVTRFLLYILPIVYVLLNIN